MKIAIPLPMESAMAQSKEQKETVERVMHEFKHGELETGTGKKVDNPRQAVAIALREAGSSKYDRRERGEPSAHQGKGAPRRNRSATKGEVTPPRGSNRRGEVPMAQKQKSNLPLPAEPAAHEDLPPHYKAGRASDLGLDKEVPAGPTDRAGKAHDPVTLSDVDTPSHAAEDAQHEWIRQRAYQLWEEEGRPEGRALDHWLKAKDEITAHGYEWASRFSRESPGP